LSIKKNYLYNLAYQVLNMALPLITVPYISRVLKPEGVGIYAYTNSIVQYFMLLAMLGIGTYGNKMVAIARDNKKELSRTFFSIFLLQLFFSFISLSMYLVFIFYFFQEYKLIALLQGIALLATVLDCSWFFSGLEDFKKIVTRNIFFKVLSLIAIFIFVKDTSDLTVYTIIMGLSLLLGSIVLWYYVKPHVVPVSISFQSVFSHFKPTIVYFLPQIATQVYFILNKTMLGYLSTTSEVGIYDYADKILKIALAIVTSLGIVMLPRMANTFGKGDLDKANDYIRKSLEFTTLLAIPIMFGLAGVAQEFVPWYMGEEFKLSANVLIILSPAIFLMAWSGVFGTQYLVPLGKMKQYTSTLYVGAIVNLIVNIILIKPYGAIGAAIGTLAAEIAVTLAQMYFIRKDINILKVMPKTLYYLVSGGIMYGVVRWIGVSLGSSIITTILQVAAGVLVYITFVILFEVLLKDGLIMNEIKRRRSRP
jgi:O-antigen/teichoic acid export membrane protein